jgi:hypothetical protein
VITRLTQKPGVNNENLKFGEYRLFIYQSFPDIHGTITYNILALTEYDKEVKGEQDLYRMYPIESRGVLASGKHTGEYKLADIMRLDDLKVHQTSIDIESAIVDYIHKDFRELSADITTVISLNVIQTIASTFRLRNTRNITSFPILSLPSYLKAECQYDLDDTDNITSA